MRFPIATYVLIVGAAFCARAETRVIPLGVDDFGDTVRIGMPPRRIVSLNPATTELLFALGAGGRMIGRTQYDTYPDSARRVPNLGPGIRPNAEVVLAARPDLVLLYASEDNRAAARRFRQAGVETISLKMDHIADFRRATAMLGHVVGDTGRARVVIDSVMLTLDRVRKATDSLPRPTVVWPLWEAPLIAVGGGSYLNELIEIAGGRNIYASDTRVSPAVAIEDVLQRRPAVLMTSAEGAQRKRGQARWEPWFSRRNGVVVIDTMLVGRPATRLGEAAVSMARLLHPGIVIEGIPR